MSGDQFYIDDKRRSHRYINWSAISIIVLLSSAMVIKLMKIIASRSIGIVLRSKILLWICHLMLLSSQLTFAILYAYIVLCIWRQYRALNQAAMQCADPAAAASPNEYHRIHRWPYLHDELTDAVCIVDKYYTIPVMMIR